MLRHFLFEYSYRTIKYRQIMKKIGNQLYNIIEKINTFCASLSGFILLFITLSIFIDVFLRYFLNRPSIWISEVSSYLFLYLIFLGTAYALQMDLHIRVTFLTDRLMPLTARLVEFFTMILSIIFCAVLLWQSSVMTWSAFVEKWTTPTILSASLALIYVSMVAGSALLLVTMLVRSILRVTGADLK